ncbi:MAG: Crp/Fnr family transcriptional regulator [Cellulosilyticaceae bacterium]
MSKKLLYKAYPIVEELDKKYRGALGEYFYYQTIEAGERLHGGQCPGLIFVLKGSIKIERINQEGGQTALYTIHEGELCHESLSCYLQCKPLDIVGYATVDTQIAILPHKWVGEYLLNDVMFMQELYKKLYRYFRQIIGDKEAIIHDSVEERLLKYLESKQTSILYITHQEIAVDIGTSREVVSRKLKKLEEEGYVSLSRGKIKIEK